MRGRRIIKGGVRRKYVERTYNEIGGGSRLIFKIAAMGVEKTVLEKGDGKTFPQKGDKLQMHYRGTLEDGSEFDSSYKQGNT